MTTQKEEQAKKNIVDDSSPLSIVREKEVDFRKYLIKTQSESEKLIEKAKKEAVELTKKIAAEGQEKADQHFKTELAKIQKQAEEIRSVAPAKAKEAQAVGLKNLDKTIDEIRNILIPR